ncbi:(2Fe-2S)-binding protein [Asticcacaulis sp. AC402]|uniref:(2Fe-2S)-binding protein n=1 Tax=Asticcacaulis sp. AC402 TaxID=1282361 RepID=UPI0003C3E3C2|nr:(2Fe-2S)-binding protein [Asticcacaulis sp. AC402]ESQ76091.1 hypothetical protein ABAC402_06490 [Asticcacaulis sp. AC402]
MSFTLTVNGVVHTVEADADTPLLWVLRDSLHLTGTKFGCGVGQCGACTVHIDGQPLRSCTLAVADAGDRKITTIEAVSGPEARAILAAWVAGDVPQCGYCQSGQIMSAVALLQEIPRPSDNDIDLAMNGNICRCGTYMRIRAAIKAASQEVRAGRA